MLIHHASIASEAGSDGVQASNDEDAQNGFVSVKGGSTNIHAHKDGIQAETDVLLLGGTLTVTTGTGSGSLSAAQPQRFGRDTMQATSPADTAILIESGSIDITNSANGAIDYNGSFAISGGTLLAIGSSGMAQAPDTNSSQPVLMVNLTSLQPAGTLLSIMDGAGTLLTATVPDKAYQSVVYSAPQLEVGDTVTISFDGTASGEAIEGLYPDGTEVSNALMAETVLLTEAVTSQGVTGFGGGMRGRNLIAG